MTNKMIEEMAVLGCRRNPQAHTVNECINCEFKHGMCDVYRVAKLIFENFVVLSQEEFKILKIKETEKHWLQTCMSVWENAKIEARKETAKEILTEVSKVCADYQWFKNLCKQYGVEE